MRKLLLVTLGLAIFFTSLAQDDPQPASQELRKVKKPSRAYVKTAGKQKIKGWLYKCEDDQIILVGSLKDLSVPPVEGAMMRIPIEQINQVSLRKKNSVLKGALIGFGAGVLTGVIIGFASGDDPVMQYPDPYTDPFLLGTLAAAINNSFAMTAGEKALAGGAAMGLTGAITGIIIGSIAKKKFIIGGKKQNYRDLQSQLMMRLVQK
jgi:hypothetical protein